MAGQLLRELLPRFKTIYSPLGCPLIAPAQLLRGLLLQVLYPLRNERLLPERRLAPGAERLEALQPH